MYIQTGDALEWQHEVTHLWGWKEGKAVVQNRAMVFHWSEAKRSLHFLIVPVVATVVNAQVSYGGSK